MRTGLSFPRVCLPLLLGLASCTGQPAPTSETGVESGAVMLTTTAVPANVKCIVLTAAGPGTTVTRAFDVTPTQPANLAATGLPVGTLTLTEGAYNAICSQVTAQTPLTWVSDAPVVVQLVSGQATTVNIVLRPAGDVVVTTTFDDGTDAGTPANAPPTIATPASASPSPVAGTTTTLSVLGADDKGEAGLVYTWATTGTPPAPVSFTTNGSNAAKTTTATFTAAGTYSFQVTVKDQGNLTVLSATSVTVTAKVTSIAVTPASATLWISGKQQFMAVARDQFAAALAVQPVFAWTAGGGGTINASGLFTAGTSAGGPYTITATSDGASGTASVTVTSTPTQSVVYQINTGSTSAVAPFSADAYATGGTNHSVTNTITMTGVSNPAPMAVYQSERYGNMTYTLPNLAASSPYTVRLHFAELYQTAAGRRVFNVSINGSNVLANLDIYAVTGGRYRAISREFTATANASGQIVIVFSTVTDNATISGIEVLTSKYPNGASCSQAAQCLSGICTSGICVGANGCAANTSCNDSNECTAADTCNSSGVCAGTTLPNNSTCTSNLNGSCQNGACACYQNASPVACTSGPSCMLWGFESNTAEGWAADSASPGGITNISVSSTRARTGTRSLAVSMGIGAYSSDGTKTGIAVAVPLCASTGTVNLAGYTFSAWVNLAVTAGTVPANAANLLQGMFAARDTSTRGTSGYLALSQANLNQWLEIRGTVNQASAGNYLAILSVGFPMANLASEGFSGTLYIDDVQLSPPGVCTPGTSCSDANECTAADTCNSSGVCVGTTLPNNSTCTSNLNGSCQNGACACYQNASPVACTSGPSCMLWGFESNTTEGWAADSVSPGGITNISVSSTRARTGTRSLAVSMGIGAYSSDGTKTGIAVAVPLCASTGTVNLAGYTFSAWVNLAVTAGTVPANAANLLQGMFAARDTSTRGTSGYLALSQANLNQWLEIRGTVNQASAGNYLAILNVGFPMANLASEGFSGTLYIDDVQLSPPGVCTPGTSCSDANECTAADTCNSSGICVGTAVPNGSTCTSSLNGSCQNGACACYQNASPVACTSGPSCMLWGFESNTAEGWAADSASPGGITNLTVSSTRARTGTRSLAVSMGIGAYSSDGTKTGIAVAVPLCASTGTVNLAGYTFSAWVNLAVTAGTVPANAANLLQGMFAARDTSTRGTSGIVALSQSNTNQWLEVRGTVNQASASNYLAILNVGFPMADLASEGFSGTLYIDDVQLSPP